MNYHRAHIWEDSSRKWSAETYPVDAFNNLMVTFVSGNGFYHFRDYVSIRACLRGFDALCDMCGDE